MELKVGKPRSLDDIKGMDVERHPIWLWVWEVGLEDQADDETWQCPVIGSNDVTSEMTEPVIALRTESGSLATASYDPDADEVKAICVWDGASWVDLARAGVPAPVVLTAVPTILGVSKVRFICENLASDTAGRAA